MRATFLRWTATLAAALTWLKCEGITQPSSAGIVTDIAALAQIEAGSSEVASVIDLEGTVWWVNRAQQRLVLQDQTGAALLEVACRYQDLQAPQRIRLRGVGTVARQGSAYRLGAIQPVVDNDGVHAALWKSGSVYLRPGLQPIRLDWFNGLERAFLAVEYEGPGIPRQSVPVGNLFQAIGSPEAVSARGALTCRAYQGVWKALPDLDRQQPVKTRTVAGFDLNAATRAENVALVFEGLLSIATAGVYTFHIGSDDGSRLCVGQSSIEATVLGPAAFPTPTRIAVGQMLLNSDDRHWMTVEGTVAWVKPVPGGAELELTAGGARMVLQVASEGETSSMLSWKGCRVSAEGYGESVFASEGQRVAGSIWVPGAAQLHLAQQGHLVNEHSLTEVLPTAGAVHRLRREQAERALPVKLRGVVTSVLPDDQAFTIHDGTRGLYVVDRCPRRSGPPRLGEYLELQGQTDPGLFAPIVHAHDLRSLGLGQLPDPIRPSWDQLMNGSLDAQRIELPAMITAVHSNVASLLVAGGVVQAEVRLANQASADLTPFEHGLVRIRGSLFAQWNYITHQVKAGEIRIYDADIFVDRPAPQDPFSVEMKSAAELRLFDPQASTFHPVRVAGQVVQKRGTELFLMSAGQGLRCVTRQTAKLEIGDQVEAVGFPDVWGGVAPILRESTVRRTGHGPLPDARSLSGEELFQPECDATRVRVQGVLVNLVGGRGETALELRQGIRSFGARVLRSGGMPPAIPIGSHIELTGVYAAQGPRVGPRQEVASFELMLDSAADLRVLGRPPWWTLKRVLFILALLACVLAGAALWITQLHRQVEQRTAELRAENQSRLRAERQRTLEQERARIAQDLHDELGSGITEVSMLAARAQAADASDEKRRSHLEMVCQKAGEMVGALDEIVWAMNPRHDSISSLVSYLRLYADRFLGLANIRWKLEGSTAWPDRTIDSKQRHQLFLAFKEALNNIVRHAQATEVAVRIQVELSWMQVTVIDNGRGLPPGEAGWDQNGLGNMRARLASLGGHFQAAALVAGGTSFQFSLPIHPL